MENIVIIVTEVQNKKITRLYHLEGPQQTTVESFWDYLVKAGIIESYSLQTDIK
jgi:hypothetical protein